MSAFRLPDLDYNAGAPLDPRVDAAMRALDASADANPHAVHERGRAARSILESARERIAEALAMRPDEIVFCSGGTEANNIAVATGVRYARSRKLPLATSPVEHPSVSAPVDAVRGEIEVLDLGLDPADPVELLSPQRPIAFLTGILAQGETGFVHDLGKLRGAIDADRAGEPRPFLHTDASQALGRMSIEAALACADLVTLSPHKVGGPRGIGVLVVREGCSPEPVLRGGSQELGRRPGTQSPRLAIGAALAIELAQQEWLERRMAMQAGLDSLLDPLRALRESGALRILGEDVLVVDRSRLLPNTRALVCDGVVARDLLPALDMHGVGVSYGSACSSGALEPSRSLVSLGLSEDDQRATVRVSIGPSSENKLLRNAGSLFSQVLGAFSEKRDRRTR